MDLDKINLVLQKYPVKFAYLFGTYNKGTYTPLSDIDIGVYWEKSEDEIGLETVLKLTNEIEEICNCELPVNLINLNNAPLPLKADVINNGRVIFDKDKEIRVQFEGRVRKEYLDFAPIYEAIVKKRLNYIKEYGVL